MGKSGTACWISQKKSDRVAKAVEWVINYGVKISSTIQKVVLEKLTELTLLTHYPLDFQMRTPVLSEIQSKILLALLLRSKVPSAEVLKAVGISGSTWNKEKMLLQNTGLIEGQITRGLAESGIVRKMEFKLTEKGRRVAQSLLAISSLMGDESFETERLENVLELIVKA
ncbi:MAG: hypothetical protein JRN15_09820 [Nitrososphaerota archaeon]|nr:hypothetical protein [Nitrososphaerota archaeon]